MRSISALLLAWCCVFVFGHKLRERFRWKTIDYAYENEEARSRAIQNGEYVPRNNVPFGVEIWRDKVFVTVPRRSPGVPSTLNYVHLDSNQSSPLLVPYPDWPSNNLSSRTLISTFRANADLCDRLWTVDTGAVVDFAGVGDRLGPPRIRVFDLLRDTSLVDYALKSTDYACHSSYTNLVVDVAASCDDAFAYAVDPASSSLLVYSLPANDSWRLRHPYFLPDPLRCDYRLGRLRFQWDDGLFGVALSEPDADGHRVLYAHPMSSLYELVASTRHLRNRTLAATPADARRAFRLLGYRGDTRQAASAAYDERSGVLFYSLVNHNAVGCWNGRKFAFYAAGVQDVVDSDDTTMIYFSDLKVEEQTSTLWAIANRLPVILYGTYDPDDYNFRIFSASVQHAIKNTVCEQSRQFWSTKV